MVGGVGDVVTTHYKDNVSRQGSLLQDKVL